MATDDPSYAPGYGQVSHHEWRTAENSAGFLLPTLQSMARSNPHLTLLDVGCGSGTITAGLAAYMPHGRITALDLSPDILARARRVAEGRGVTTIDFQQGSVYALPFPDRSFDVVHASMVTVHLADPLRAFREMLRVAKPGGVVADRESDLRMWSVHPDSEGMRDFHRFICDQHVKSGGTLDLAPKMVGLALQAGASRAKIQMGMGTWTYSTPAERRMWGERSILLSSSWFFFAFSFILLLRDDVERISC